MRRLLVGVLLCFALPASVLADHVAVPEPASDSEAFAVYFVEFRAQSEAILETYARYQSAESTVERSAIQAELRAGFDATIDHLEALDRRACFADFATTTDAYLGALADALGRDVTPDQRAGYYAQAETLGLAFGNLIIGALSECAPVAGGNDV